MPKPSPRHTFQSYGGWRIILLVTICMLSLSACGLRRNPLPAELLSDAAIPGMSDVRSPAQPTSAAFRRDLMASFEQEMARRTVNPPDGPSTIQMLTLSGGGANGAFGAGVLCGWTEAGTRPVFKIATGISTGALIAPFAFIGARYDATLRHLYTSLETSDLISILPRLIVNGTFDAVADSFKVKNLIARYYDPAFIAQVASAHEQGRRLYVGTASLDAGQLIVWNMGAIAQHNTPEAIDLFQKVLLAAVSIPILFPPVKIDVEAQGQPYDELHVDGGIVRQVFVFEILFELQDLARQAGELAVRPEKLYVIQNLPTQPVHDPVKPVVTDIAYKSVMDLFANQGVGDLYRIYARTEHQAINFNLISIPPDFKPRRREIFDHEDMVRLFEIGFEMGRTGVPWQGQPPGWP